MLAQHFPAPNGRPHPGRPSLSSLVIARVRVAAMTTTEVEARTAFLAARELLRLPDHQRALRLCSGKQRPHRHAGDSIVAECRLDFSLWKNFGFRPFCLQPPLYCSFKMQYTGSAKIYNFL